MLTIAYIGNGKSTNRYHIPFVNTIKEIKIKKVLSRSEPKWDRVDGVTYVKDFEEIYDDAEIQLVVICTYSETHYEIAKQALLHNKNVLIEKPFTETAAQARELFALAKERNLFLQCYQNRRYDADYLTMKKVIDGGLLGDLLEVEINYDYYRAEQVEKIHTYKRTDGFVYGYASHALDQVFAYFGVPEAIRYDTRQTLGKGRFNDYFDYALQYGSGLKVSVKGSFFRIKSRPCVVVYGRNGMFIKEKKDRQDEQLKIFYLPGQENFGRDEPEHYGTQTYYDGNGVYHEEKVISEVGDYSRIYRDVYESIVHGKEKPVKDEETIRLVEILEESTNHLA